MIKFLKISLSFCVTLFSAILVLPLCLLRPFNLKNATIFCKLMSPLSLKILGIHFEKRDFYHLEKNQPAIIIANHQHTFDIFTMSPNHSRATIAYVGKKSLALIPFMGWVFWLSGEFLLDRKNHHNAMATLDKAKKFISQTGSSLWLMPEGTRSWTKGMGEFKKGAFNLSLQLNLPIIPVVYSSYSKSFQLNSFKRSNVIAQALPPFSPDKYKKESLFNYIDDVRNEMIRIQKQLDEEIMSLKSTTSFENV